MATNAVTLGLSILFDKGKMVLPVRVRKKLNVKDGDELVFFEYVVSPDSKEVIIRANVAVQEKARFT